MTEKVDNSMQDERTPQVHYKMENFWRMNLGKQNDNKWKKALFGAAIGTTFSGILAFSLYFLSGQGLYLAIIGLGAGIGFSIGGGLDHSI
jgi:hypothetical protein